MSKSPKTYEATILESTRVTSESTDEVRRLLLQIEKKSFKYREGENIGVLVAGTHVFGNRYHHRYYSIANAPGEVKGELPRVEIFVGRCFHTDEETGIRYPGIASNYLCDAAPGDRLTVTGPFPSSFHMPKDDRANLVMIGAGTGVAPFRSFIQRIYNQKGGWQGKVRLYYGAKSGMDFHYLNRSEEDRSRYYDETTFQAFQSICSRDTVEAEAALGETLRENAHEVLDLIREPDTHIYLAGRKQIVKELDQHMVRAVGSEQEWKQLKKRLHDERRWSEVIYRN